MAKTRPRAQVNNKWNESDENKTKLNTDRNSTEIAIDDKIQTNAKNLHYYFEKAENYLEQPKAVIIGNICFNKKVINIIMLLKSILMQKLSGIQ